MATLGTDTATQARALLAQFVVNGQFDHCAFLDEMEARSLKIHGKKLLKKQQRLLARIVAVYIRQEGITSSFDA